MFKHTIKGVEFVTATRGKMGITAVNKNGRGVAQIKINRMGGVMVLARDGTQWERPLFIDSPNSKTIKKNCIGLPSYKKAKEFCLKTWGDK